MNIPNKLTISRLLVVPLFIVLLVINTFFSYLLAFLIFVTSSVTDTLDGMIARRKNKITNFGIISDPISDKILICVVFVMLLGSPYVDIPEWAVALIILREFLIIGVRLVLAIDGKILAATKPGKYKMTLQALTVAFILGFLALISFFNDVLKKEPPNVINFFANVFIFWLVVFVAIFTFVTGLLIVYRNKEALVTILKA